MLKAVHETKQQVQKARFLIETNQKKQETLLKKVSYVCNCLTAFYPFSL